MVASQIYRGIKFYQISKILNQNLAIWPTFRLNLRPLFLLIQHQMLLDAVFFSLHFKIKKELPC